jgi:hypothetical protein
MVMLASFAVVMLMGVAEQSGVNKVADVISSVHVPW